MKPSRIVAVEHVTLQATQGIEESLRWFYGELCRLEEVSTGPAESLGLRFRSNNLEIRLQFVERPCIDPIRCRLTIAVPSLREATKQLEEQGLSFEAFSGFTYTDRRLATLDPSGNRVELKQEWPENVF